VLNRARVAMYTKSAAIPMRGGSSIVIAGGKHLATCTCKIAFAAASIEQRYRKGSTNEGPDV
jgi:hypothetical protein